MTTEEKSVSPVEVQREEAKKRATACAAEMEDLLGRYACKIVPMLTSDQVGDGPGMKALLGATYCIMPDRVD